MASLTVGAALAAASAQLAETSPSARLDAQILLAHSLGRDAAWLIAHADEPMSASQRRSFDELADRRFAGEPVAHITGRKEFWSLALAVTRDVLIPRPETELVVERALAIMSDKSAMRVLDLGTGSGAIALAIASERPACDVTAVDISQAALAVARENARRCAIDNVRFARSNWFDALPGRSFDLIVANPPYVAATDPHLTTGDLRFEPQIALRAGADGFKDIRTIVGDAPSYLEADGHLILEHGFDQQSGVATLLMSLGYREFNCFTDHAGQPRVTECRAPLRSQR